VLRPVLWIRKGNYRDLLYFEIGKKLYAFRSIDVERLERDEILGIPVYQETHLKIPYLRCMIVDARAACIFELF